MILVPNAYQHRKPPYSWTASGWGLRRNHWARRGLIGHWLINESGGNILYDVSGNRNHGTINGAVWGIGRNGGALDFDGSTTSVSLANLNWTSLPSFSVVARVRITNYSSKRTIIGGGSGNGVPHFYVTTSGVLVLDRAGFVAMGSSVNAVSTNVLTTLAVSYNASTGDISFYIDGNLDDVDNSAQSWSSDSIMIGRHITMWDWLGSMSYFRLYNRVLLQKEMKTLHIDPYPEYSRTLWAGTVVAGGGRTTKNTDAFPLGDRYGMSFGFRTH